MEKLLVHISILLKYVLQVPMLLYSMQIVSIPVTVDMYLRNRKELTQVHVQHPYIAMSADLYILLALPEINPCSHDRIVYYCEKTHFLRHLSRHAYVSATDYQMESLSTLCTIKLNLLLN